MVICVILTQYPQIEHDLTESQEIGIFKPLWLVRNGALSGAWRQYFNTICNTLCKDFNIKVVKKGPLVKDV